MIRQLKPGEVIKEGDFRTYDSTPFGERMPCVGINGFKVDRGDERDPIFREIPDSLDFGDLTLSLIHPKFIQFAGENFSEQFDKESTREILDWLLEIAEAME